MVAVLLALMGAWSWAADCTWTGTTSANWGTTTNWLAGAVPTNNDRIIFDSNSTANLTTANNIVGLTGLSIVVTNPAGAVTIATNAFTLGASGIDCSAATQDLTISANLTLAAAQAWTVPASRTLTISGTVDNGGFLLSISGAGTTSLGGIVSNTGAVTKTGNGALSMGAAHTYSGGTTLTGGALVLAASSTGAVTNGPVGTGTLTINPGTSVRASGASQSIANAITIAGDFANVVGSGAQDLTWSGLVALTAGATITVSNTSTNGLSISGVVSGAFPLAKGGAGVLTLSGANTYSGGFTLAQGTVSLNVDSTGAVTNGPFGTGTATILGGTVQANAARAVANQLQLLGDFTIGGSQNLTLSGSGTVPVQVQVTVSNTGTTTLSGALSGGGGVTKAGTQTLKVSGANSWTGSTIITAGTLQSTAANVLPDTQVVVTGGTLDLNGFSDTIGALTMTAGTVQTGAGTVTLGGTLSYIGTTSTATITGNLALGADRSIDVADGSAATDLDCQALVSGAFALTKTSAGTLKLSATNTWTGATTITAGTVLLTGSTHASSAVTVGASGTLSGTGTVNGTVSASGTLVPGNGAAGTLTTGAATLSGSPVVSFELGDPASAATSDAIASSGAVVLAGNLDVTALTSFGVGTYTLMTCTGTPTGTLTVRTMPAGYTGVINLSAGKVDLVVTFAGSASFVWTGGSTVDSNWTTAANWGGGSAPTGSGSENLIFRGTRRMTPNNDFAVDTAFGSVTFEAGGFTITGNRLVMGGTLTNSAGANTISSASISVAAVRTVSAASGTTLTLSNVIIGAGGLNLAGAGTVVLSGANTFSGGTTLAAGTVTLGVDTVGAITSGPVGTGTLTVSGGTLQASATRSIANALTVSGGFTVGGSAALTVSGAVTMAAAQAITLSNSAATTLSGAFTPGGDLTLAGAGAGTTTFSGALTISAARTITNNATAGSQVFSGSVAFDADLTVAGTRAVTIGAGAITLSGNRTLTTSGATVTVSGAIGESGGARSLTKAGTAQLTLSAANTFSGGMVLNAGTLAWGNAASAGTGTVTINGGTIRATGSITATNAVTVNASFTCDSNQSLFLTGATALTVSPVITVTNSNANGLRFGGVVSGGFAVTKAGSGVLQYAAANTYTGTTTISTGTLRLIGDVGAIAGNLVIGIGTTFDITNNNVNANPDRIPNAASVTMQGGTWTMTAPSNISRTETIGSLVIASGGNQITLTAAGTGDAQITAGSMTVSSTLNLTLTNATGLAKLLISSGYAQGAPVPGTTVGAAPASYDTTLGVVAATPSTATTRTTSQSGSWDSTATWVGGVVPSSSDEVVIAASHVVDLNGANRTCNSLTLTGSGGLTGAYVLTVGSGQVAVSGSGSPAIACSLASSSAPWLFSQGSSGVLTVSGGVAGSGGLAKNGSGQLVLSAATTFTGVVSLQSGTLTLLAANAYAGGTTVVSGTVLGVGDDLALGSGTLTMRGGSLRTEVGTRSLGNAWAMPADFSTDGSYALTLSGAGTVSNGIRNLTINNSLTTLSGNIGEPANDSSGISKRGTGKIILSGQNTWTGIIDWAYELGVGSDTVLDGSNAIVSGPFGKSPKVRFKGSTQPQETLEAIGGPRTIYQHFFSDNTTYFQGANKITFSLAANLGVGNPLGIEIANTGTSSTFELKDAATVVEMPSIFPHNVGDSVNKQGPGTLIIGSDTCTGTATVNAGTLRLVGDTSVHAFTAYTINPGGTVEIDATGTANPDRIPDTASITLAGGILKLSAPVGVTRSETVGSITVTKSGSQIILAPSGNGSAQITSSGITGLNRTSGDLALTRGTSGGSGTGNLFSPSNALVDGQGVPWASVDGSARAQYSAANGLIAANGTLYTTIAAGSWNMAGTWDLGAVPGASDEVSIGHTLSLNGAGRSVRRVRLTSGSTLSASAGETLHILGGELDVSGSGSPTISADLDFASEATIAHAGSGTLTISGPVHGSAGFSHNGTGTTVLSAANQYFTGNLAVNLGRLQISGTSAYTGSTTIRGGATLAVSGGAAIPDTSTMTMLAGARLEVASGTETVSATSWSDFLASTISIASGGQLRLVGTAGITVNSQLTGAGDFLTSFGAFNVSPLLANPHNDLSGTIEAQTGRLRYNQDCLPDQATIKLDALVGAGTSAHGVLDLVNLAETIGALSGNGYVVNANAGPVDLTVGANNASTTFGAIAPFTTGGVAGQALSSNGPGLNLVKVGSGSLTMSGLNTYTGTTTVKAGSLIMGVAAPSGSAGALGNAASSVLVGHTAGSDAASLLTSGAFTVGRAIVVQGGGSGVVTLGINAAASSTWSGTVVLGRSTTLSAASGGTCTFSNVISGSAGITKSGLGTVVLSAANTWSGATTVAAGTLQSGAAGVIADTVPVSVSASAVWDLAGFSETVGSIAGAGNISLGAGTLTSGGLGTSTTFSGALSGSGGVTKAGSGTLTLSGTNSHTGATAVNAGALSVTGSLASGSAVTIASGATLLGTGTAAGTIAANGTIAPGVGGPGTLSTGAITMAGTTVLTFELGDPATSAASDHLACSGAISLNGNLDVSSLTAFAAGTYTLITYSGSTPTNNLTLRTIPSGYAGVIDLSVANQVRLTVTTLNTAPPTVALASPVNCPDAGAAGPAGDDVDTYGHTFNRRPKLIWTVPTDADGDHLHFVVRLDQVDGTTQVANSSSSQSGFSWYNGSAWVAFPAGGATSGVGSVRFTPQADLALDAAAFWTVVANDGTASSAAASVRRFLVASSAWTDASLVTGLTQVRKPHVDELRSEANRIRAFRGLAPASWSDTSITANQTLIRAVHFTELRTALEAVDAITGAAVTTWSEAITAGVLIKASHISELRTAIGGL